MTDLTDRMRTCAAALLSMDFAKYRIYEDVAAERAARDAADLLIEASNVIETVYAPTGLEPMQLIPPVTVPEVQEARDILHDIVNRTIGRQASPHACPKCDSRAAKKVRRDGRQLVLTCPVCVTEWPWKPQAEWR